MLPAPKPLSSRRESSSSPAQSVPKVRTAAGNVSRRTRTLSPNFSDHNCAAPQLNLTNTNINNISMNDTLRSIQVKSRDLDDY